MKKKILGVGVTIILIAMLILLTGCGNENTEITDNGVQNTDDTKVSQEERTEIQVKEVKAVSENYAVVTGYDNSTYIIDKEGNYQGTIPLSNDNVLINNDGYIATKPEMSKVNIYDKTGKELFKTDDTNKFYFVITDSNLLLRRTTESSFSGNTSKTEIIDVDGNTKFETILKELLNI